MNYRDLISILEVLLLAGVFVFLFRFIFFNYTSKVRKPATWVHAVKKGLVSPELLKTERRYPDRIRFYNIWMQADRIINGNIPGDFAELGVYKGETARIIHLCAPERKLHLFDTFEGFPTKDLTEETGKAAGYTSQHFADTSEEKVRNYIGDHPNLIFHKGYFPASTVGLENKKFAFVSMDADLHNPTRAGLEFFYPRLSEGGVILIHDYNSDWPKLVSSVDVFCASVNSRPIPVPDADSTVMIIK